jgi:hypothetical protein
VLNVNQLLSSFQTTTMDFKIVAVVFFCTIHFIHGLDLTRVAQNEKPDLAQRAFKNINGHLKLSQNAKSDYELKVSDADCPQWVCYDGQCVDWCDPGNHP